MTVPTNRREAAPPLAWYLTDAARAVSEYGMFLAAGPWLPALPRGDGQPVLVLPGLMTADSSTRPLRLVLKHLGYRVHGWGLGRNIGPTARAVHGMRDRLDDLAQRYRRPVSIVGWSLGGIFARELARRTPDSVRQVITLGSPIRLASESQSRAHRFFERYSHLHIEHWQLPLEHGYEPLTMPATSIYSKFDGIVAWRACLDDPSPRSENIAVLGSHLGLGHHPAVVWAVTDRLAEPEGAWRPFRAPALLRHAFPRPDVPAPSRPATGATA
ncbi:esterase/lipase family protein [Pseudonocardia nigra]|uniref:esterase/lipase family protein n=1 Tax=Pseudonocardia nigra TaxID=1921578 RepID=UPI001C5CFA4B|nr:alpha/beta hydrolase [Pseudonocardia nigra]